MLTTPRATLALCLGLSRFALSGPGMQVQCAQALAQRALPCLTSRAQQAVSGETREGSVFDSTPSAGVFSLATGTTTYTPMAFITGRTTGGQEYSQSPSPAAPCGGLRPSPLGHGRGCVGSRLTGTARHTDGNVLSKVCANQIFINQTTS